MATLKRRLEKAESHGAPRHELAKEWVGFMKAMQGIPGIPLLATDEIIEAAARKRPRAGPRARCGYRPYSRHGRSATNEPARTSTTGRTPCQWL
jgi:hypothetical protein